LSQLFSRSIALLCLGVLSCHCTEEIRAIGPAHDRVRIFRANPETVTACAKRVADSWERVSEFAVDGRELCVVNSSVSVLSESYTVAGQYAKESFLICFEFQALQGQGTLLSAMVVYYKIEVGKHLAINHACEQVRHKSVPSTGANERRFYDLVERCCQEVYTSDHVP
jgi:hypothetical protein